MPIKGDLLSKPTYSCIQTMAETGNTGVCYRAYHEVFGREVVQKTVVLLGVPDSVVRSEPELLDTLDHPNVIQVSEAQWATEEEFKSLKAVTFVTPYYEGGSIHTALQAGHRFSVGDAIEVTVGILSALHYLHVTRDLLHRDIKPDNVFLDAARRHAYVGDLGSAAARVGDAKDTAVAGGTPLYRPPESAGTGRFTVKGDLYGAGMVLLEMLNGPLPYANLTDVDSRVAVGRSPVVGRLLDPEPRVPTALATLVRSLTNPDPAKRPDSAAEVITTLRGIKHMDWVEVDDDHAHRWTGHWPPRASADRARRYEITATPVMRGPYAGKVRLEARWRRADSLAWTRLARLTRPGADDGPAELRSFFREVSKAVAQIAAAS